MKNEAVQMIEKVMPSTKEDLTEMVLEGTKLSEFCSMIEDACGEESSKVRYMWIIKNWHWLVDVIEVIPRKTISNVTILTVRMEEHVGSELFNVTSSSLGLRKDVYDLCMSKLDQEEVL